MGVASLLIPPPQLPPDTGGTGGRFGNNGLTHTPILIDPPLHGQIHKHNQLKK